IIDHQQIIHPISIDIRAFQLADQVLYRKNFWPGKPEPIGGVLAARVTGTKEAEQREGRQHSCQHSWKDAYRLREFNFFDAPPAHLWTLKFISSSIFLLANRLLKELHSATQNSGVKLEFAVAVVARPNVATHF